MLDIFLLGSRAVVDATTGEVRTRSARSLALVAMLALQAGVPQPRVRVAAAFWPASSQQQAHTNLRREVHQLRAALGTDTSLSVTATDLTWSDSPTARVDLREFQRARERMLGSDPAEWRTVCELGTAALQAFGGELLPGVYDDWVLAERDRLAAACVEVCGLLSDVAAGAGRWEVALAAARRRVELAPFEEAGHRELIRLHARRGDRAAAVSAYHHCAQLLDQELGVEPDPRTRRLLEQLVAHTPSAGTPEAEPRVAPTSGPALRPVGLVGRRAELAVLTSAADLALSGGTAIVLLVGEPGVGKSRLATEAARANRRRAVVATAHCYDTPGRLPLAPVAEWLAAPALVSTVARLAPVWRAEVARLVPEPGDEPGDAVRPQGPRGVADAWQRHRFFQGLALALRPEHRPLVLVLDDFHWCDEETLDLLSFVLGGEAASGLLVLLTARAGELAESPVHGDWVRRQRAAGRLQQLAVPPLGRDEVGELLGRLTGRAVPDDLVDVTASATGGFPLHVIEATRQRGAVVGAGAGAGEPDLAGVLGARLDQLPPHTAAVAALAAATGGTFDLDLMCQASDLDPDAIVRAVDELWRLRIVREGARGYEFTHDLLREAAYARVHPPARWLLHRRLAQALHVLHEGHTDEVAAQLADQYSRAGDAARALEHYHRAAEVAARVFAHAEAVRLHQAARRQLAAMPDGVDRELLEIRTLTAMAASLNADRGYADAELVDVLERTVGLAERHSLRAPLVDALVGLWASRFVRGEIAASLRLGRRALAIAEAGGADTAALSGQAHFAVGGSSVSLGRLATGRQHLDLASRRSPDEQSLSIGSHSAIHARAWSAHATWLLGDPPEARACAADAVERARSLEHPYSTAIALAYAAVTWQLTGDRDRLLEATGELASLAARHGFAYYPAWGLVLDGWATAGPEGVARMERGIADLRGAGAFTRMPYWLGLLAERATDPRRARAILDAAVVAARAREDRWWLPELLRRRAGITDGPPEAALRTALDLALAQGSVTLAERCRRDLAATRPAGRAPGRTADRTAGRTPRRTLGERPAP